MYSDMSMRTIACSESNMNSARARASSVLPTPVGPRKRNVTNGRLGSCRRARERRAARARAAPRRGARLDRLVLPNDALVQALLHVDQLLRFALEQAAHRDAGPACHHFGHVIGVDLILEEDGAAAVGALVLFGFQLRDLSIKLGYLAVA